MTTTLLPVVLLSNGVASTIAEDEPVAAKEVVAAAEEVVAVTPSAVTW